MSESYFNIIGLSISTLVGIYEIYNHIIPYFKKKCPSCFGIDHQYHDNILQKLRIEQCYKKQFYGLRTIVGLYEDIDPFLSRENMKIGCLCCKRKLTLREFYNIIINSFEWRKMKEMKIENKDTKKSILFRCEQIDNSLSPDMKKDVMSYYWTLHKRHD